MLRPLPMQRVELTLLREEAPEVALLLAEYGNFDPEASEATPETFPELPGMDYLRAYAEARAHLDKILAHFGLATPATVAAPLQAVPPQQLAETGAWLKAVWEICSEAQEGTRKLREEYRRVAQLQKALDQFMAISVDLTLLQNKSGLLDVRIGALPRANVQRFEEALALAGYVAIRFFASEEQAHLIIAGATGQAAEIEHVLQAASWRTLEVPAEFHGRPDEVRRELEETMAQLASAQANEDARRRADAAREELRTRLLDAVGILARAAPCAELADLMRGHGNLATVSGWVPEDRMPQLRETLAARLDGRVVLQARAPRADELRAVPSAMRHHRWLQPFARLVLNYGVPRYGEIDPTILFAVSSVLMFGMMFGDVGHGAIIALAGIALRRRLGEHAALAVVIGLSSMAFGLLYGSAFGFEHLFPALWIAPLTDPLRMLEVALGWGVGFIALATALTIRNRIAAGRVREALLDSHGAAGLLLYLALLYTAWRYATEARADAAALAVLGIALAAMFTHTWQHNHAAAPGERLLIVVMEGFEAVMAYVSNTLSFLRLAAFSLNHVALAVAIFTVANMLQTTGYWVTVVLGNIFILVLEGAIVAIQTLRLEYYEGFSRFFGGDGRPFRPLALGGR